MADEVNFDFSEIEKLAADLGHVPESAGKFLLKALKVTSGKVKDAANESVQNDDKSGRWKGLTKSVDYDIEIDNDISGASLTSEIGYNPERYGNKAKLGNLREFGAPGADGVPLAPHNDLLNALHANEADFIKGISDALSDAEKAAGL